MIVSAVTAVEELFTYRGLEIYFIKQVDKGRMATVKDLES